MFRLKSMRGVGRLDNVTHGLLGAAIGMLRRRDGGPEHDRPLTPTDKAVVWASVLAAEMPDLDVFLGKDELDSFVWHRGFTHSLLFAPAVALAASAVCKAIWRGACFRTLYAWSLLSVLAAHLANDFMSGWGTRVLWPFTEARLRVDWVPIIDLLYTVPLLIGVLLAWRRPHVRRAAAAGVLAYLLVYAVGYRGISNLVVRHRVANHYAAGQVRRISVMPDLFSPFKWLYTVDVNGRYEQGETWVFGNVSPSKVTDKVAPAPAGEDQVVSAILSAPGLKPYFDQFSWYRIHYVREAPGFRATIADVRYEFRGRGFMCRVQLDQTLQILETECTW